MASPVFVIDALVRFAPAAEAAMLFVIRGESATGWKRYCRARRTTNPSLAVPMDQPGLVLRAAREPARQCNGARPPRPSLGPIDRAVVEGARRRFHLQAKLA